MATVKPIPDGYPQVIPYLSVEGASEAIDFYTSVLGAKERMRMPSPELKCARGASSGTLPPSGRAFEFWASMWQHYEQGRLAEERHHLDLMTMMTQIGAVPGT